MIIKVDLLLDANPIIMPENITILLEQIFKDNDHLAKIIVCEAKGYIINDYPKPKPSNP